jgi:predicted ester cyclase
VGIPATGKSATVTGIAVDRIVNGKIAESWGIFDQFGMMQQLGVIPMPEAAVK